MNPVRGAHRAAGPRRTADSLEKKPKCVWQTRRRGHTMAGEMQPLWELESIHKHFPGVKALDGVDIRIFPGEVHGLLGENGSGKSTLVKCLSGVHQPTAGRILLRGVPTVIHDPFVARSLGIATIYQELSLVPNLTVAENIFLGRLPRRRGFGDRRGLAPRMGPQRSPAGTPGDPARSRGRGLRAVRLGAADRGDREGAVPGREPAHHGRADSLPGNGRGGAPARHRSQPRAAGLRRDLHFPPAGRGDRARGLGHRHEGWQGRCRRAHREHRYDPDRQPHGRRGFPLALPEGAKPDRPGAPGGGGHPHGARRSRSELHRPPRRGGRARRAHRDGTDVHRPRAVRHRAP